MKKIIYVQCDLCRKCQVWLNAYDVKDGYKHAYERACDGCINHRKVVINVDDSSEEVSSDVS